MKTRYCAECGKTIVMPEKIENPVFCSDRCYDRYHGRKKPENCRDKERR